MNQPSASDVEPLPELLRVEPLTAVHHFKLIKMKLIMTELLDFISVSSTVLEPRK
jgi:hypothetical protein